MSSPLLGFNDRNSVFRFHGVVRQRATRIDLYDSEGRVQAAHWLSSVLDVRRWCDDDGCPEPVTLCCFRDLRPCDEPPLLRLHGVLEDTGVNSMSCFSVGGEALDVRLQSLVGQTVFLEIRPLPRSRGLWAQALRDNPPTPVRF